MTFTEECEVCKKELKEKFVWVNCTYWDYHPVSECSGGCTYPVGMGCVKKIPKKYQRGETTVQKWADELEKHNEEADQ